MTLRLAMTFILAAASPGWLHAQGISTHRDAAGNIPRDRGSVTQGAPRPMTNNAVQTVQAPTYLLIRRPHTLSIPFHRVRSGSGLR